MATKENDKATQQDASEQESSKGGVVIRALVILALVVFLAKPYLFKEETTKDTRQLFKIHGVTMGTTWNASVVATPETLVALNLNGVADESGASADRPPSLPAKNFSRESFSANSIKSITPRRHTASTPTSRSLIKAIPPTGSTSRTTSPRSSISPSTSHERQAALSTSPSRLSSTSIASGPTSPLLPPSPLTKKSTPCALASVTKSLKSDLSRPLRSRKPTPL